MKKMINTERIEGRIYQHNLGIKTVQNQTSANFGKEFISGNLEVAVDEAGLNVIPVHYTYVTATTASGNENRTYTALKRIIDEDKTWIKLGKDEATKVRIDTSIALNDFYNQNDELISTKVNEGGFVTIINGELGVENERNTFSADMVITNVKENIPEEGDPYVTVRGAIFNFRNALLPVDFTVRHKDGMKYFLDLEVTNAEPIFTKIWGKIECRTIVNEVTEESAFGEGSVRTYERKVKEWNITGTAKIPYDFGDEKFLTSEDLTKAMQDRQTLLAEIKAKSDEYKAQKAASASSTITPTSSSATTAVPGGFNF